MNLQLRGLKSTDLPALAAWLDDPEVTQFLFAGLRPSNLDLLEEQRQISEHNPNEVTFAVCCSDVFIGTTGLYSINWVARSAEFRVLIGDKSYWGKGIGTECTKLMVVYGFDKLNLNKVWLGVNRDNIGGFKAYLKAGLSTDGILREEIYRNGRYYDAVRMSILRSEYEAKQQCV